MLYKTFLVKPSGKTKVILKIWQRIWAILNHCSSIVDQPKHDKCSKGENSWCPYQRDIATGQRTYKPAKWPLTKAFVDVYCTHYLFNLQMKVSSTGTSKGALKTQMSHSIHYTGAFLRKSNTTPH